MHDSVLAFLRKNLTDEEVRGKRVAEIGSQDVNGSPRPIFMAFEPLEYIGMDSDKGKGVDLIVKADVLCEVLGSETFDIVISTEMLEHVVDWRLIIGQMKGLVKPGGLLIVTTRSPGFPYHPYPIDMWRYTLEDGKRIFADMEILALENDPQAPGIFVKMRKPETFAPCDLSTIELQPAPQA